MTTHFDQLSVGQTVRDATTVTETHLVLAAGIFKDFNPVHVDESFAAAGRFGSRVVHGALTAGMMVGVLGNYLGAGALAFGRKTALIWQDQTWTYAALNAEANRLANGLAGLGVQKGDRVAVVARSY